MVGARRWQPEMTMSDDGKPVWPWIVALLIGLPVLYVASFGPACWMTSRLDLGARLIPTIYKPIVVLTFPTKDYEENPPIARLLMRYAELAAIDGWVWQGYVGVLVGNDLEGWDWEHPRQAVKKLVSR